MKHNGQPIMDDEDAVRADYERERNPEGREGEALLEACTKDGKVDAVNDVIPVREVGTGFLLLAREVFERIEASEPEKKYRVEGSDADDITHAYFETPIVAGRLLSEDWELCRKALLVGIQPRVHIGITLGHVGKMEYRSSLRAYMKPTEAA